MPNGPDHAVLLPIDASLAGNRGVVFERFGGAAPIAHCLRTMLEPQPAATAVVAVSESMVADVEAALAAEGVAATVVVAAGHGTRAECLSAGLAAMQEAQVLVHDIRHPLASAALRDRVLAGLRDGNAIVVPALPMVDSVKSVNPTGTVTATVDRSELRALQFPRGFESATLAALLRDGDDELQSALRLRYPVTLVSGDPDAFALDIPKDLRLAAAMVERRLADR